MRQGDLLVAPEPPHTHAWLPFRYEATGNPTINGFEMDALVLSYVICVDCGTKRKV
jgi:hypothetical protein